MELKLNNHIISVIIPTINRKSLRVVLEALNEQTRKPDEIIVMEDKERLGQNIMRNRGFEKSKGDLIVFLDDDVIPGNKWLENFEINIVKYNADGVSSGYLEVDNLLHQIRVRRHYPKDVQINPEDYFGIGGNVMYKRECLVKCLNRDGHIFNPSFKHTSEDIELVWRLKSADCKLVYIQNDVRHLKQVNAMNYFKFQFIRGRGLFDLNKASKNYSNKKKLGNSLLWNDVSKSFRLKRWVEISWQTIIGPFDYKSFSRFDYFVLFWAGEKAKALGFLFSLLNAKIQGRKHRTGQDE